MPEEASQDGRFEPLHDAHAIEQMALALHFEGGINESAMLALRKATDHFKTDLPGVSDLQTVTLAVGNFPAGVLSSPRAALGRSYKLTRPDGTVETELRLEGNVVNYQTTAYTRWVKVWESAWRYLSIVQPIYLASSKLAAVSLNYVDKFHWLGEPDKYRPSALLRPGSRYISPHVHGLTDLWHSHTGAYLRPNERTKRLMNVNLDCLDQQNAAGEQRRVIQITTVLTDMLNQPGYTATDANAAAAPDFVANAFSDLHRFSKELIAEVLNDDMCTRIALNDPE